MEDFREKTISGLGWSIASQIGKQAVNFVISVILARLLTPADFGLVGMVVIFTGFAALFNELGFGAALVQKEEVEERHYSSTFWLNVGFGFLLMIIVTAVAPWIATFFDEPRLIPLTRLISINFFLGAFAIVQRVLLRRELNFRTLASIEFITILISGTIAIILALQGYGPYALVWQTLAITLVSGAIFWTISDWYPQLRFDYQAIRELSGFSTNLLGFNVINYWIRRADNLIIGRFLGSEALGIYGRAYSLMLLPLNQVSRVIGRVMFPALSRIQTDKLRVKRLYLRAISSIALITFPLMLGLLVVSHSFVLTLYGPKWVAVVPILQILSVVGLVQSVTTTAGWIYNSQGRSDWLLRWAIAVGILNFIAFGVGIRWGIIGLATAYAIRVYVTAYFAFSIPGKLINLTVFEVGKAVMGSLGCSIVMATVVWTLGLLMPAAWPHWANLVVQVPFGVVLYIGLIHLLKLQAYQDIRSLAREHWYKIRTTATLQKQNSRIKNK